MAGILKPEEEELIKAAGSIIKAVGYKYSATVGTVITAAEKAATVHKIVNITSRFCHKLNSKLGVIGDKLPSNAEMFNLYTQYFLTKEDSQAVYNKLISTGILNDAGEVIEADRGKIVTKIRALDLERNDQFKNKVIIFCFKLQDLEGKSKQETRDRIAFNAEQMITNRIMQLVKAEVLSPAIGTVMGSGVNAITDKLRQASELSKHRVKQEMQKHYHKVTLTVDDPNPNTETPVDQPKIENPFRYLNLKKLASTASFCSPLSPEMLEALRNPKAAAEAAAAKQKALDDWYEDPRIKCHLPYERYTSMFMSDATAAVKQKALDDWYNDPRIKCHLPYERYTSMFMSHSNTATTATDDDTQSNTGESSSDEQKALCVLDQGKMGVDINKINSVQKAISQGAFRLYQIYKEVEEHKKKDITTYNSIVIDPAIIEAEQHPGMLRTLVNAELLAVKYVGKVTTDLALKYSPTELSTVVIAGGELIGHGVSNVCNLLQQVWEACAPNIAQESARALGSKMGELHQILKENTTSGEQFAMYLGAGLLGDKAFSKLFSAGGKKVPLPSVSYAEVAAAPVIEEGMLGGFVCRDRSSGKVVALFDSVKLTQKSAIELPNQSFAGLYGNEAVKAQLQHAQMIKRHVETMIKHGAMAVEASTALEQEVVLGKLVKQYQRQYSKYQQLSSLEEALAYELKMVGKGQVTGTPGHAEMSRYIAQQYAKDPEVAFVFLDQGMKKITGLPIKPNRRPDVVVVGKDGKINCFEVRSITDADAILKDRMAEVMGKIPQPMRGKKDVIKIPGVNYKD